jgi:hypothetical protein
MTPQRAIKAARAAAGLVPLLAVSDAGGLGALTEAAEDVLLPRAEVTAIGQHPGKVGDGRAPR